MFIKYKEFLSSLLTESLISDVKDKFYSDIDLETFNKIVGADQVSSNIEKDKIGKYAKWLLKLYKNTDKKRLIQDLGKATNNIILFDKLQKSHKIKNVDLNSLKEISDMFKIIKPYYEQENISNTQINNSIKSNEAETVYEDDEWKVVVPKTEAASCLYGANTQWCTAAKKDNKFDEYDNGNLYININKITGRKYQFHFEENQFMDETDSIINTNNIGLSEGLLNYYRTKYILFDIRYQYDKVGDLIDGLSIVELNEKYGFVNEVGDVVIPIKYEGVSEFEDGLAAVSPDGSWGFIDKNDNIVIPFMYYMVCGFKDGYAEVVKNGEWGWIDIKNNFYDKNPY